MQPSSDSGYHTNELTQQASRPKKRLTRGLKALIIICIGAFALALAVFFRSSPPVQGYAWAKAQGWSVAPVREVYLTPHWLTRFESLPPPLSAEDWQALVDTNRALKSATSATEGAVLQQLIAKFPTEFYPKEKLAQWYSRRKNQAASVYWEKQALAQAPTIIAGRVRFLDGRPLAHSPVELLMTTYEVKKNRILAPIDFLSFATSDSQGYYYIPVFKGVYDCVPSGLYSDLDSSSKTVNVNIPPIRSIPFLKLSSANGNGPAFIARSHVAVLPTRIARYPIAIYTQYGIQSGNVKKPVVASARTLRFHWNPVHGAKYYLIQLQFGAPGTISTVGFIPKIPGFGQMTTHTSFDFPLNGNGSESGSHPLLYQDLEYSIQVFADRDQELNTSVNNSLPYYFMPLSAYAPLPLTQAGFTDALGPGVRMINKTQHNHTTEITLLVPSENKIAAYGEFYPYFGLTHDELLNPRLHGSFAGEVDDVSTYHLTYYSSGQPAL